MLAIHVIGSGSKGNAAIVENAGEGRGVLVDCGICKRDVFAHAASAGFDMGNLEAILVTHDHSDHVSKTGVIVRGLGRDGIPMYVLPEVASATAQLDEVAHLVDVRPMAAGEQFEAAGMRICPVRTSHDAAASCGFRFETGDGDALGYATDTGFATDDMLHYLRDVRILAIESNHDVRMLREGPYPRYLQDRILSDSGHLSNDQAADVVRQVAGARLKKVVAMHLSEHNNLPSLARESLEAALADAGVAADVLVASQRMLVNVI